jgi:hypothetical protein
MFAIEFDQRHNVLLVNFSRRFTDEDLTGLDDIAEVLVAAEGPMSGIFDYSRIEGIDIVPQCIVRRGRQAQRCPGLRRAIIAPQPEIFILAELFAQSQNAVGSEPPRIVRTMPEALAWIGVRKLQTRPVEIGWIREQARLLG